MGETATSVQLGNINKMILDIDTPLKMNVDMEFQQLCLMCGKNGSGKSLILKLHWCISTVVSTIVNGSAMGMPIDNNTIAQYVFDNTFDDQNFNGTVRSEYDGGTMEIILEAGQVKDVILCLDNGINRVSPPIFMSTDMRTFDQIKSYLKVKKIIGPGPIDKMLEMYKLYDILYVESLCTKLQSGHFLSDELKNSLVDFEMDKYDMQSIHRKDDSIYFLNSKGEQSMLNMLIGNEA